MDTWSRRFEYDAWANERVLAALESADLLTGEEGALLAHVLAAEEIWLRRLQRRETTGLEVFPAPEADRLRAMVHELPLVWRGFLEGLERSLLEAEVSYTNSRGERFSNPAEDLLTHVVNHGTHHRAQIASALRRAGHAPPGLDYITWLRR